VHLECFPFVSIMPRTKEGQLSVLLSEMRLACPQRKSYEYVLSTVALIDLTLSFSDVCTSSVKLNQQANISS